MGASPQPKPGASGRVARPRAGGPIESTPEWLTGRYRTTHNLRHMTFFSDVHADPRISSFYYPCRYTICRANETLKFFLPNAHATLGLLPGRAGPETAKRQTSCETPMAAPEFLGGPTQEPAKNEARQAPGTRARSLCNEYVK